MEAKTLPVGEISNAVHYKDVAGMIIISMKFQTSIFKAVTRTPVIILVKHKMK